MNYQEKILEIVKENTPIVAADVAEKLKVHENTVRYHARKLIINETIKTSVYGYYIGEYPGVKRKRKPKKSIELNIKRDVLNILRNKAPIKAKEIIQINGIHHNTLSRCINMLRDEGFDIKSSSGTGENAGYTYIDKYILKEKELEKIKAFDKTIYNKVVKLNERIL